MPLSLQSGLRRRFRSWVGLDVSREDLASLLEVLPRLNDPLERTEWLASLFHWLRSPTLLTTSETLPAGAGPSHAGVQAVRVRYLLLLLERNPPWKSAFSRLLGSLLAADRKTELLADTGLSSHGGIFGELAERLVLKALPQVVEPGDLRWVLRRVFPHEADADWFETCPDDVRAECAQLVMEGLPDSALARIRIGRALGEALLLLGARVAGLGSSPGLRRIDSRPSLETSPFLRLQSALSVLVHGPGPESGPEALASHRRIAREDALRLVEACRSEIRAWHEALESRGVSVTIVFQLEQLELALGRISLLTSLYAEPRPSDAFRLCAELIRAQEEGRGLRGLLTRNFQLFSRKIAERVGASGEHYIVRTPREYRQMFVSALGGGVLTVLTTLIKFGLKSLTKVPFLEGLAAGLNYAISFTAIQLAHFTLATKQPSMTAAALAARIPEPSERDERSAEAYAGFLTELIFLLRSHAAALCGNLAAGAPTAWLVGWAWKAGFGAPILSPTVARDALLSLDPFSTPTLFYAALTGVLLWISSVLAGAFENWVVYERLPLAFSTHPIIRQRLGAARAERWAGWFIKNAAGVAGSVSLGLLLGFFPVFAHFFGLPLDVRHVTLAACQAALALASLPAAALSSFTDPLIDPWLPVRVAAGVLAIGCLNIIVSFSLAAYVALRARKVDPDRVRALAAQIRRHFARRPLDFVLPVRARGYQRSDSSNAL